MMALSWTWAGVGLGSGSPGLPPTWPHRKGRLPGRLASWGRSSGDDGHQSAGSREPARRFCWIKVVVVRGWFRWFQVLRVRRDDSRRPVGAEGPKGRLAPAGSLWCCPLLPLVARGGRSGVRGTTCRPGVGLSPSPPCNKRIVVQGCTAMADYFVYCCLGPGNRPPSPRAP